MDVLYRERDTVALQADHVSSIIDTPGLVHFNKMITSLYFFTKDIEKNALKSLTCVVKVYEG